MTIAENQIIFVNYEDICNDIECKKFLNEAIMMKQSKNYGEIKIYNFFYRNKIVDKLSCQKRLKTFSKTCCQVRETNNH